jgi:hypothetical protein
VEAFAMKTKTFSAPGFFTILMFTVLSGFFTSSIKISAAQTSLSKAYQDARIDAAEPKENELINNLTAIDKSTRYLQWEGEPGKSRVLVATFTTKDGYRIGNLTPKPGEIWVTVVPELKDFCQQYNETGADQNKLNLRLKQLLGLPPSLPYTHVAEIWVPIQYLKRPSLDPEINDRTVQLIKDTEHLKFPQGVDSAYQDWFVKLFYNRKNSPYPWTSLGYTYDWEPKTNLQSHAGLSEFVIFPSSDTSIPVEIKQILSTEEYCKMEGLAIFP